MATTVSTAAQFDLQGLILGDLIGSGQYRNVYACAYDSSLVIKEELGARSFCNVREWDLWNDGKNFGEISKWLAPCVKISACGIYLVQKKTMKLEHSKYPEKIPSWFSDTKYQNWGRLGKNVVCHDYANNSALLIGITSSKLKRVAWWDDSISDG
jgi:hypothetical protein